MAPLPAREVYQAAWGRPCAGGTVTDTGIVYDSKGGRRPVTEKPVGWSRTPQPAVRIGNELVLISDLVKAAWGGGAQIAPGMVPGYQSNEER